MKRKILNFCLVLVLFFTLVTNVKAASIAESGDTFVEEGTYESLRLVAANDVTSNATIDGISIVAGNKVTINSNVTYGLYAGNLVTYNGTVTKDLFMAGNAITIGSDAIMPRDVYIAANSVDINGNIGRDLRVGASKVDITGITIDGDAYISASEIVMDAETVINGKLMYEENAKVTGLDIAQIGEVKTVKSNEINIQYSAKDQIYSFCIRLIAAFIVMVVLFFLIPNTNDRLNGVSLQLGPIAKAMGIGLLVLIALPLIAVIALFTGFLTPLAVIALVVYGVSIYLSPLLSSYVVGNVINTKLFKNKSVYLSLAIGIVLVRLLAIVPVLGGWINLLALLYGLGLIFNYITSCGKEKKKESK